MRPQASVSDVMLHHTKQNGGATSDVYGGWYNTGLVMVKITIVRLQVRSILGPL